MTRFVPDGFMTNSFLADRSPLADPTQLPFRSIAEIVTGSALASVVVIAPHPDDETLGCGGAVALLRSLGHSVRVLVMSDGTRSHPNSRRYPPLRLRAVREAETIAAMKLLGVESAQIRFLQLPDGAIPGEDAQEFNRAVAACQEYLTQFMPETLFLPYRFDPHPDHRATWQIVHRSLLNLSHHPRRIEYPIWDWDPEQGHPLPDTYDVWRLDISSIADLKQQAIDQYQSQITDLIDDDPEGFRLTPDLLAHFTCPWEVYLENHDVH
jgi:LmbE family N-acetylglucosaminyl deacetylase